MVLSWRITRDSYGIWRVESISLESVEGGVPSNWSGRDIFHPHPRLPPEAIVWSQLSVLLRGDIAAAEAFVARCGDRSLFGSDAGRTLAALLSTEGPEAALGDAALPSQRRFLQEVLVTWAGKTSALPVDDQSQTRAAPLTPPPSIQKAPSFLTPDGFSEPRESPADRERVKEPPVMRLQEGQARAAEDLMISPR